MSFIEDIFENKLFALLNALFGDWGCEWRGDLERDDEDEEEEEDYED